MERMIVQLNLEVISENTKTIQTQTVAKPVTGTVRAKPAGAQYVATLGSNLDSESKLSSDESQSGF